MVPAAPRLREGLREEKGSKAELQRIEKKESLSKRDTNVQDGH